MTNERLCRSAGRDIGCDGGRPVGLARQVAQTGRERSGSNNLSLIKTRFARVGALDLDRTSALFSGESSTGRVGAEFGTD